MTYKELEKVRRAYLDKNAPYNMISWKLYNYKILGNILYRKKTGKGRTGTFNNCIIMGDTETSKAKGVKKRETKYNHVCAWTISIRAFDRNIVTLWGQRPSDMIKCFVAIQAAMPGEETYIYFFNLNYDWCFLRKFFFKEYGHPDSQLNTKPHYPLFIKWKARGLVLKDALMLAQRSLNRWAKDLNVEHQKAVGSWDYDIYRDQDYVMNSEELKYIECDTLAGVECIDATLKAINKSIYSIPYTATGVVRNDLRALGKKHNAHERFLAQALTFDQYLLMLKVYHGGFTHANRFLIDTVIEDTNVLCKDFASSYPFVLLSEKYPSGKFIPYKSCDPDKILKESKYFCFFFKLEMFNFRLKDQLEPMPALQYYKIENDINIGSADIDNGRVIRGGYAGIWLNEVDLQIIMSQYEGRFKCTNVYYCAKSYLPRWITDYIYRQYEEKCKLKGGDPVLYALAKSRLNSIYGLFCTHSIMDTINEDYDFAPDPEDPYKQVYNREEYTEKELRKLYDRYLNSKNSILNYQIGCWVTSYAQRNLILGLGSCINDERSEDGKRTDISHWFYSDTDSIYSDAWNEDRVKMYNELCKMKLRDNGYGPVIIGDKEFWLGIAENDKTYYQFKFQGAKRYCGRGEDDKLHITVAGVPKKGAECLHDDINNFVPDFIFDGETTGKKIHYYMYIEDIYIDEFGNEVGDSIDLQPCDYRLDCTEQWSYIDSEEITIQIYDQEGL